MAKKYLIFLIAVSIFVFGLFVVNTKIAIAADTFLGSTICHRYPACGGTQCNSVCSSFKPVLNGKQYDCSASCRDALKRATDAHSSPHIKFKITCYLSKKNGGRYTKYSTAGVVCSVSDKCFNNKCGDRAPFLRAGGCDCEAKNVYKVCCKAEGNGYVPVGARGSQGEHGNDDGVDPEEGWCGDIRYTGYNAEEFSVVQSDVLASSIGGWDAESSFGILSYCKKGTNCGCPMPPKPFEVSLSTSPSTITKGDYSRLTWSTTGAAGCSITNLNSVVENGSRDVNPSATTTYTLSCHRSGNSNDIKISTATITVNLPPFEVSLSASPTSITRGGSSRLTWSATNATGCSITGIGSVNSSGNRNVSPTSTTTYTLSCSQLGNSSNRMTAQATVTVTAPLSVSLSASPTSITRGGSSRLTWSATNATGCSITGIGSVNSSGNRNVSPTSTTTYTLSCSQLGNSSNRMTAQATVTVTAPLSVSLSASPSTIAQGDYSRLTWSTTSATNCSITGIGSVNSSGNRNVSPTSTTTYTLSCSQLGNSSNRRTAQATVTVNPCISKTPGVSINELYSNPKQILINQSAELVWNVSAPVISGTTTKCAISVVSGDTSWPGASNLNPNGKVSVSPQKSTVYRLTCRNTDNSSGCYKDSDPRTYELKVFTSDIEETPALRNEFMILVGRIGEKLKGVFN